MIVGDTNVFAIESDITAAYERLSLRGLGYFVIYLASVQYGVRHPRATMLACSYDTVVERIRNRGRHHVTFADNRAANDVATAFRDACYCAEPIRDNYFGLSLPELRTTMQLSKVVWAPDGDEAFDDGSYVLQFDLQDRVRIIGFKSVDEGNSYDPASLREVWLTSDCFYQNLLEWRDGFERCWAAMPKV